MLRGRALPCSHLVSYSALVTILKTWTYLAVAFPNFGAIA